MASIGKLRAIKDSDIGQVREWRNVPEVRKNMYTQHVITEEEHLRWWSSVKERKDQLHFIYENEGRAQGVVSFTIIDTINSNSSWAFYASPDAVRGTGTKMELLALDFAFEELSLHKLYCEVLAYNEPVLKLHAKFGFKTEGIFREHRKINGKFIDVYRLGMLSTEWPENRKAIESKLKNFK